MKKMPCLVALMAWFVFGSRAMAVWDQWPPRDSLLKSLVAGVEPVLKTQDPQTGRFGTQPWICTDQNVLLADGPWPINWCERRCRWRPSSDGNAGCAWALPASAALRSTPWQRTRSRSLTTVGCAKFRQPLAGVQ